MRIELAAEDDVYTIQGEKWLRDAYMEVVGSVALKCHGPGPCMSRRRRQNRHIQQQSVSTKEAAIQYLVSISLTAILVAFGCDEESTSSSRDSTGIARELDHTTSVCDMITIVGWSLKRQF